MIEQFKSLFVKLECLSSTELDRSAEKLVVAENGNIAKLIAHIAEMSARKLALKLGYKNLYQYCIQRLNLSEGAVPARIHVANVSRRFPQLLVALAENRISLTVASLLAPHLREHNVDKLISDCAGMTRKETEEYLVKLKPKPVFEPSIRRRPSTQQPVAPPPQDETPVPKAPEPPLEQTPPKSSPTILQPARPDEYNFRFAADRDFKDKFERLAEVLGVENAQKHMADILETALDIALDKKDPKKKLERRKKRANSAKAKSRIWTPSVKQGFFASSAKSVPPRFRRRGCGKRPHRPDGSRPCPTTERSSKSGRAFSTASTKLMPPFLIPAYSNEPFCIYLRRGLWALLKTPKRFQSDCGKRRLRRL
jgi:hypothetical protein